MPMCKMKFAIRMNEQVNYNLLFSSQASVISFVEISDQLLPGRYIHRKSINFTNFFDNFLINNELKPKTATWAEFDSDKTDKHIPKAICRRCGQKMHI